MSIKLFGNCGTCGKRKFITAHRSYKMSRVSQKPITSVERLCGRCFKAIKKITLN